MKRYLVLMSILLGACVVSVGCQKQEDVVEEVIVPEAQIEIEGSVVVEETLAFNLDFPAFISEVHVKEGQKVAKGDILVTLNLEDYLNQIEQKKNEIELYKLQLKELGEVLYPQNPHINQITQSIALKEDQLANETDADLKKLKSSQVLAQEAKDKALKDYEVMKELYEVGAASREEVTELNRLVNSASKQVEDLMLTMMQTKQAKQLEIDSLKAQLKDLQIQVTNGKTQSQSSVDTLKLQIETATLQLENMESKLQKDYLLGNQIIAPNEGLVIQDMMCQKGSRIELIQGALLTGLDTTTLVVSAYLPEEYSKELQIGDQVEVIPYTDENEILVGIVTRMSENAVENYGETVIKTIIKVEEDKGLLKVGGNVDVRIVD